MTWILLAVALVALSAASLRLWRLADAHAEREVWHELLERAGPPGPPFEPSMLEGLPEPAQRYFRYTIVAGAPLVSSVEVEMAGRLGLGDRTTPSYRPMTASEILVPEHGLVWRLSAGSISGSDGVAPGTSWTRFWLFGLFPVVRASGKDHYRSALGRVVAEAAFWVPSSLLPSSTVAWEGVDDRIVRATIFRGGYSHSVELTVEPDGRPARIVIQRWSNENPDKEFREQPFGGYLTDFREVSGYRLPMHVEGGNHVGTSDYFPFFQVDVKAIRFAQLTS
jgi:hypothetical protein